MNKLSNVSKLIAESAKKLQTKNLEMKSVIKELCVMCRIKYGNLDKDVDEMLTKYENEYCTDVKVEELILNAPLTEGYWWWREKKDAKDWELCHVVSIDPFKAKFFNGAKISDCPWGVWKEAVVK